AKAVPGASVPPGDMDAAAAAAAPPAPQRGATPRPLAVAGGEVPAVGCQPMRAALVLAVVAAGCSGPGRPAPLVLDQYGEPLTADAAIADAGAPVDGGGAIARDDGGTCWQVESRACDPGEPCQPPPPRRVSCPRR